VRTTVAPTRFWSGVKDNILPEEATAILNVRIRSGESMKSVLDRIKEVIDDVDVAITIVGESNNPSPTSSVNSDSFKQISSALRAVFPEAAVSPTLVIAGTDSQYYRGITTDAYRIQPVWLEYEDLDRIHGTDERLSITQFIRMINFYIFLMQAS
jgi:carboxypeptidase PM20D1